MFRLAATVSVLLSACAVERTVSEEPPEHGTVMPIIFEGETPDRPEHEAVVSLHELTRNGTRVSADPFCTGTLIAEDLVLTAAHCLDVARPRANRFEEMDPADLAISFGDRPRRSLPGSAHDVADLRIHPRYDRNTLAHDIALVRLVAPVTDVTPVPPLPSSMGMGPHDIGATADFAGFGLREDGGDGVKLHVEVDLVGPGCALAACPDGGFPAIQVSYRQRDGGPCSGDSGGPLFLRRGPAVFVAGVTSCGDAACTRYGVSARVDAYERFIASF
jgi:secreted trypsin-like serine protease